VLNGPEMHRWHHADSIDRRSVNFATKIAVWDWLFGTAYLPASKPGAYGLWGGEYFPERPGWRGALFDYFVQHAWAFRSFGPERAPAVLPALVTGEPRPRGREPLTVAMSSVAPRRP
jgi:hypothetical protein